MAAGGFRVFAAHQPFPLAGPSAASELSAQGTVTSRTWIGHPPALGLFPQPRKGSSGHELSFALSLESVQQSPSKPGVPSLLHKGLAIQDSPLLWALHTLPPHSGDHWVPGEPHDAQASGGFCLKAPHTCLPGLPGCTGPLGPVRTPQQVLGGRALSWGPAKMSFPRSWHRHLEAGGGRQPPTPPQHHVWSPPALHHILQRGQ